MMRHAALLLGMLACTVQAQAAGTSGDVLFMNELADVTTKVRTLHELLKQAQTEATKLSAHSQVFIEAAADRKCILTESKKMRKPIILLRAFPPCASLAVTAYKASGRVITKVEHGTRTMKTLARKAKQWQYQIKKGRKPLDVCEAVVRPIRTQLEGHQPKFQTAIDQVKSTGNQAAIDLMQTHLMTAYDVLKKQRGTSNGFNKGAETITPVVRDFSSLNTAMDEMMTPLDEGAQVLDTTCNTMQRANSFNVLNALVQQLNKYITFTVGIWPLERTYSFRIWSLFELSGVIFNALFRLAEPLFKPLMGRIPFNKLFPEFSIPRETNPTQKINDALDALEQLPEDVAAPPLPELFWNTEMDATEQATAFATGDSKFAITHLEGCDDQNAVNYDEDVTISKLSDCRYKCHYLSLMDVRADSGECVPNRMDNGVTQFSDSCYDIVYGGALCTSEQATSAKNDCPGLSCIRALQDSGKLKHYQDASNPERPCIDDEKYNTEECLASAKRGLCAIQDDNFNVEFQAENMRAAAEVYCPYTCGFTGDKCFSQYIFSGAEATRQTALEEAGCDDREEHCFLLRFQKIKYEEWDLCTYVADFRFKCPYTCAIDVTGPDAAMCTLDYELCPNPGDYGNSYNITKIISGVIDAARAKSLACPKLYGALAYVFAEDRKEERTMLNKSCAEVTTADIKALFDNHPLMLDALCRPPPACTVRTEIVTFTRGVTYCEQKQDDVCSEEVMTQKYNDMCTEWLATAQGSADQWTQTWNALFDGWNAFEKETCSVEIMPSLDSIEKIADGDCIDAAGAQETITALGDKFCKCPATRAIAAFYDGVFSIAEKGCTPLFDVVSGVDAQCAADMPAYTTAGAIKTVTVVLEMADDKPFSETEKVDLAWMMISELWAQMLVRPQGSITAEASYADGVKSIRVGFPLLEWENGTEAAAKTFLDASSQSETVRASTVEEVGGTWVNMYVDGLPTPPPVVATGSPSTAPPRAPPGHTPTRSPRPGAVDGGAGTTTAAPGSPPAVTLPPTVSIIPIISGAGRSGTAFALFALAAACLALT